MIGTGDTQRVISAKQVADFCEDFVAQEHLGGKRILAVIPDSTRTAPVGLMFRTLYSVLAKKPGMLDFLIALGTHPPMTEPAIENLLGLKSGELADSFRNTRVFNHDWKNESQLRSIGAIDAAEIEEISHGLMHERVDVRINSRIFGYDALLIVGPTFPHEVVGFSGGNKYLFPGIAGQEILNMFHWLGALITNPVIIGRKETPVRRIVDTAASLVPVQRLCISLVVGPSGLSGMYCGTPEEAWSAASGLSEKLHIIYKDRPFQRVLSCAPLMYDELWVGGKCAYKLEPVVEDGGELIIYAPHLREVSVTHGTIILQIGYHVRDYFTKQMERFAAVPRGVLAHSTHVKGIGTFDGTTEKPRIHVTLATGIPEGVCKNLNLGYRDPSTLDPQKWMNRESEGILCAPKAGEILYRLQKDPFYP